MEVLCRRRVGAAGSAAVVAVVAAAVAISLCGVDAAVFDTASPTLSVDVSSDAPMHSYVLGGDAKKVGNAVRLTSDDQSQVGWLFTRDPVSSIGEQWRVDLSLRISGKGVTLFGDGMAFWYTREPFTPPPEGIRPAFGHSPSFTGLAIFFDTYDNDAESHAHKHPYVSAMINDGTLEYQHDELTGVPVDKGHPDAGCHARIRQYGMDEKIVTARVEYDGQQGTLSVKLLFTRDRTWKSRPAYEWTNCLRMTDVHLPAGYYLGMSASTGDLSDTHDVVGLDVYTQVGADVAAPPAEHDTLPSVGDADSVVEEPVRGRRSRPTQRGAPAAPSTRRDDIAAAAADAEKEAAAAAAAQAAAQVVVEPVVRFERAALSEDEEAEIDAAVSESATVRRLMTQATSIAASITELSERVESRLSRIYEGLDDAMEKIKDTEVAMEARIAALEARVGTRVDEMVAESRDSAGGWVFPFLLLAMALAGAGVIFVRGYRKIMKTHML